MGDYFLTCSNHIELLQCWLPPTTSLWNVVTPVFTLLENHITATSICELDEEEIWYFTLRIYSYTMKERLHHHYTNFTFPSLKPAKWQTSTQLQLSPGTICSVWRRSVELYTTQGASLTVPSLPLNVDDAQQTISWSSCLESTIPSGVCPAVRLTLRVWHITGKSLHFYLKTPCVVCSWCMTFGLATLDNPLRPSSILAVKPEVTPANVLYHRISICHRRTKTTDTIMHVDTATLTSRTSAPVC